MKGSQSALRKDDWNGKGEKKALREISVKDLQKRNKCCISGMAFFKKSRIDKMCIILEDEWDDKFNKESTR